jgi:CxxC motif-containing protein (DUF1111 family)
MSTSLKRTLFIPLAASGLLFLIAAGVSNAQVQLNLQPGVQLTWTAPNSTNTYHLQWSPSSGGAWADLVPAITGDGVVHTLFDPVQSGARLYQDLEIVPGTAPSAALPANSGFETGTGPTATSWTTDTAVGGPVYGVRTNDSPNSGAFNYQVHLASTGAGPLVEFSQAGVPVTGGTTYPFSFYSKALAGSQGQSTQWRILWNAGGDTGFQTFTPGNGSYSKFSTSVIAPMSATSGTIYFHCAGAAVTSFVANIDFDDVVLGSGSSGSGTPASTNVLSVSTMPMASVSWLSANGVLYYAESSTNPAAGWWTNSVGLVVGNGGTESFMAPMTNSAMFFRLDTPPVTNAPPTNLHQVPSGSTNAIGLAWTASLTPGISDYQMTYTDLSTTITNTTDLGNVTSTIISGLTSGDTYFVSIIAVSGNGQSDPATLTAQPDTTIGIIPLFNAFTILEPDTVYDTPSNHVTRISDRPRLRHAREDGSRDNPPDFSLYDTYAIFYWQQRMTTIEIDDFVAKGGSSVLFHMWSLNGLDTPNIRFFFQGQTTVAQYGDNEFANQADSSLTNWTFNLTHNASGGALHVGDKIEMEFSPFMLTVTNGQLNYYGGVILYIVGQGIVPWQTIQNPIDLNPANDGPTVNGVKVNIDSNPMPSNTWLAGSSTMPVQYSGEPTHLFNQLSPGASPPTGEPFLLGRRLHHTDFGTGAHVGDAVDAGGENGVFTQQVGKLGPKFTNRSCVSCHIGNGRALPPAIGAPMIQSVVHVASDASGTPDPVYGSVLQPQITSGTPEGSCVISSYATINGTYGDSTPYTLQQPNYSFSPHTPAFFSVRLAPQLVGMGLLEAIDESTIEALADPSDLNSDGISGKLRTVTDPETGQLRIGRFTYRGAQARISHQIASALRNDMGVTTTIFPVLDGDVSSGPVELADSDMTNWVRYVSALGVNAQRNSTNATVVQGQALFGSAGCWKCHTPTITTSAFHPMAELRNQVIHPYTDMLLHDMGPGLADNLGEGNAAGSEWRTSPLWNIGLTAQVSGGEAYLHDGRARNLAEAILWHDGEGAASREAFRNMSASDRAALIAFLQSL